MAAYKQLNPDQLLDLLPDRATVTRFVVAFSGGLDSSVLLLLMVQLRNAAPDFPPLSALHIHHGISANADQWTTHCQQVCDRYDVPLDIQRVTADTRKASLENNLREARYESFTNTLQAGDVLLQAHHRDDQVETLLLRLFRGSGLRGSAGIPAQRALGAGQLCRPLLGYSRARLHDYAVAQQLDWVEDESNLDERFDRNYLRARLLPVIKQRWPGVEKTLPRFAAINDQSRQALAYLLEPLLAGMLDPDSGLRIKDLLAFPEPVQINLLRMWLERLRLAPPEYHQYHRVLAEVVAARPDAQPLLIAGDVEFRRHAGSLVAQRVLPRHDAGREWRWDPARSLELAGAGILSAVRVAHAGIAPVLQMPAPGRQFTVKFRSGGERCRPVGRSGSHPLKKLLQESAVPPWLRNRVPLVYLDDELVAVADLWVCEGAIGAPGDGGLMLEWQRP